MDGWIDRIGGYVNKMNGSMNVIIDGTGWIDSKRGRMRAGFCQQGMRQGPMWFHKHMAQGVFLAESSIRRQKVKYAYMYMYPAYMILFCPQAFLCGRK
jgi:hypothetical protein